MNIILKFKNTKPYKKFISEEFKLFRQIFIYIFFGGLSTIIDIGIYSYLVHFLKISYLTSNAISASCGLITSFILNTFFNFKPKDDFFKRFILFIIIGISGILLSQMLLWLFHFISSNYIINKIISALIVAAYQFVLNKVITYKEK